MKKIQSVIIAIIFIVLYIILIQTNESYAITQTLSSDVNTLDDSAYPGIKQLIKNLQTQYPNWKFKILYTDLDWNEVIANEYTGHQGSPKNLVQGTSPNYSGEWICPICGKEKVYDNGSWNCASEVAIKYMMDPRNSINSSDVFQFMELTYTDTTFDSLKSMVANTFLDKDTYINAILDAGKAYNVNPYYIVARILQEQGKNGSSTVSGTYPGYQGYYNIFNFSASGNTSGTILERAHKYAKDHNWTSIELSIKGGVEKIASGYISKGQNTLYLQKFDVENSDGELYWHQYMQNVLAAQSEGSTIKKQFTSIGKLNSEYTFIIPVYKNMPATVSRRPGTQSTGNNPDVTTDLVKVNVNNTLAMRDAPNGNKIPNAYLYKDEIVTRLEKATGKVGGTYWDKVMKSNGVVGYAARETYESELPEYKLYLVPIQNEQQPPKSPDEQVTPPENSDITKNDKVKLDKTNNDITIIPGTTIQDISELIEGNIVVKNANGEVVGNDVALGTGFTINDTYKVILLGDASGDGIADARDASRILKYSVGTYTLNGEYLLATDINKDGMIDARDASRILKYSVNQFEIEL